VGVACLLLLHTQVAQVGAVESVSLVGSYTSETYIKGARDVAIDTNKGHAYVLGPASNSLAIIDVGTDPSSPSLVGSYISETHIGGEDAYAASEDTNFVTQLAIDTNKGHAYVAGYNTNSLAIIDVGTDPSSPSLVGSYTNETYIKSDCAVAIDTNKGHAYVLPQETKSRFFDARMVIIDVGTDPSSPSLVGSFNNWTSAGAMSIDTSKGHAYLLVVLDGDPMLQIIDVGTNPPSLVGSCNLASLFHGHASSTKGLAIDTSQGGNAYAYVTDYWGNLAIINVTNPSSPLVVMNTINYDDDVSDSIEFASSIASDARLRRVYVTTLKKNGYLNIMKVVNSQWSGMYMTLAASYTTPYRDGAGFDFQASAVVVDTSKGYAYVTGKFHSTGSSSYSDSLAIFQVGCGAPGYGRASDGSCGGAICTAGTYSTEFLGSCTPCPAGTFSPTAGAASCTECFAGTYKPRASSSSCTNCTAGKYSFTVGATSESTCIPCEVGYYSYLNGSSKYCTQCPEDTYTDAEGSTDCKSCSGAEAGATSCETCELGQWSPLLDSDNNYCVDCPIKDACDGTNKCEEGYQGFACASCKDSEDSKYFLLNGQCRECPKWRKSYSWLVAGAFAAFLWLGIYYATGTGEVGAKDLIKESSPFLTLFTISVTHFQVTSIYLSFTIKYPGLFVRVASWVIAVFSFDVAGLASPECSSWAVDIDGGPWGYSQRWWIRATMPLMLMAPFAIKYICDSCRGKPLTQAVHSIMAVLSLSYVFAIQTAMEVWVCHDYGEPETTEGVDETWRLDAHPDIRCNDTDERWPPMMAGSFFLFAFYCFGLNAFNFFVLRSITKGDSRDDADTKKVFGFLFLQYKKEYPMWELVSSARKLVTVIASVAIARSGVGQASVMLVVVLAAFYAHVNCMPYGRPRSNALESNLLLVEILQLILTLICEGTGSDGVMMAGLLLSAVSLGGVLTALAFALETRDWIRGRSEEGGDKDADIDAGRFVSVAGHFML
jgi:hypothetical protein